MNVTLGSLHSLQRLSREIRIRGHESVAIRAVVLAACVMGCNELEVFPARIQIPQSNANVTFEAYARLRKVRTGDVLDDPIVWHPPEGVTATVVSGVAGRNALVSLSAAGIREFAVEVSAKGERDRLIIEVVAATGGDYASAPTHVIPSVLAVFGNGDSCPRDSTYAFVSRANLGDRRSDCFARRVITFASSGPPTAWIPPTWTNSVDAINGAATLRDIPVRVWNLSVASTEVESAKLRMKELLTAASGLFYNNRVGLNFTWDFLVRPLESDARTCRELHALINQGSDAGPDPTKWSADGINVYWVGFDATDSRAKHCWGPAESWPKNVVRVEITGDILVHSLAHEFGHVSGLYVPWGSSNEHMGHVDDFSGFAKDNLMYGNVNFGTTAARTRLSIGQVFRMHFDPRSWLVPAGTPNECGCDPYASICGRLSRDTRQIKKDHGELDEASQGCSPP